MDKAKMWVALLFLIITSILSSNLIPVSSKVHVILSIISVALGAFSTWRVPNADTPTPNQVTTK